MQEITLQQLLEAGCHFGHKAERWHPKASAFIYTEKDGIHIIDLAKTKAGLEAAAEFIRQTVAGGGEVLFVATKRQAKGVVQDAVVKVGAPYFVERWIGGFLTNWDGVKLNIDKIIRLETEKETGAWKKFPKHEQSKLTRYIRRLKVFYGGVLTLKSIPQALVIFDVKKETVAVREGIRRGVPIIGVVDTNSDPTGIDYVIPANDDAVGSIQCVAAVLTEAYKEGKDEKTKEEDVRAREAKKKEEMKVESVKPAEVPVVEPIKTEGTEKKPRERAKKINPTNPDK